ncbi:MAG: hypothetical protein JNJ60_04825 [Rhodocyclaceae bacterium]|nr:hypothetical protein [Rhodocyclaceae bacterium]
MIEPTATPPQDELAALVAPDLQKTAARMAQDAFARLFRLCAGDDAPAAQAGIADMLPLLATWARAGRGEDAQALRLALLVAGLDQWGLAYSQAFGLTAIPALSDLMGSLRNGLDARADARFQRQYAALAASEAAAIDFKVELRRGIHLALWHAMVAAEQRDDALAIFAHLGGALVAQAQNMPHYGWRIVADALAHVQIACLEHGLASQGLALETTQGLFDALGAALPKERWDAIRAHSARAMHEWQMARRAAN